MVHQLLRVDFWETIPALFGAMHLRVDFERCHSKWRNMDKDSLKYNPALGYLVLYAAQDEVVYAWYISSCCRR